MFANGGLLTLDGVQNTDMSTFAKVSIVNVTNDFTIDPGTSGTASGGTFTNTFAAVPEPFTSALAGLGLALVGAVKVCASGRSKKAHKGAITNA